MFVILSTSANASVDKLANITLQVHKYVDLLGHQFIFVINVREIKQNNKERKKFKQIVHNLRWIIWHGIRTIFQLFKTYFWQL